MLKSKATKRLVSVFTFMVAALVSTFGFSASSIETAVAASGDGDTTGVEVVTLTTSTAVDPSAGVSPSQITSSQSVFVPKGNTSGNFSIAVNPSAGTLGANQPTGSGIVVEYEEAPGKVILVYVGKQGSGAGQLYTVQYLNGIAGTPYDTPSTNFQYTQATGVLSVLAQYRNYPMTVYNYVTAAQLPSAVGVYARQTNVTNRTQKALVTLSPSAGSTPQTVMDDTVASKPTYTAQNNIATEQNVFFDKKASGEFLGLVSSNVRVYAAVLNAENKVVNKWELQRGVDYDVSAATGKLTFMKKVNASCVLVDSEVVTDDATAMVVPTLKSRSTTTLNFVKATGYIYRCENLDGTVVSNWGTNANFIGLTANNTYLVSYAKLKAGTTNEPAPNTIVQRKYKTSATAVDNYTTAFAVGNTFTANINIKNHITTGNGKTIYNVDLSNYSAVNPSMNSTAATELGNIGPTTGTFHSATPGFLPSDSTTLSGSANVKITCKNVDTFNGFAEFYLTTTGANASKKQEIAGTFTVKLEKPLVIELQKESTQPALSVGNNAYSLKGARYGVYTDATCSTSALTEFVTNASGYDTTEALAAGNYYVKEITPPTGMHVSTEVFPVSGAAGEVKQVGTAGIANPAMKTVKDEPVVKTWTFNVLDKQSNAAVPQSGASLANAVFEVKYYDVTNTSSLPANATKTWYMKTDATGTVNLDAAHYMLAYDGKTSDPLYATIAGVDSYWPLGYYQIKQLKESDGYFVTDTTTHTTLMTATGNEQTQGTFVKTHTAREEWKNQVIRGDFKFNTVFSSSQERSKHIPFLVINETSGEAHVVVTNENGDFEPIYDNPAGDPNKLDILYDPNQDGIYSQEEKIAMADTALTGPQEQASYDMLLYFTGYGPKNDPDGSKRNSIISAGTSTLKNQVKRCMPYGVYTVEELPCAANRGMQLVSNTVTIRRDAFTVDNLTINSKEVTISTYAIDKATGGHEGDCSQATVTIKDEVDYKYLTPGKPHKLTTTLHVKGDDGSDQGALRGTDGNVVTATTNFTPTEAIGTQVVEFVVPSSLVVSKTVVVFEELESEGIWRAEHKQIASEDQTVTFPNLSTVAKDGVSGTHEGVSSRATVDIKDEVAYSRLMPGTEYTVVGVLMDKATGQAILDKDGKKVTASIIFKPETAAGTINVTFASIPTSLVAGKTVVVFETLSNARGPITAHADINDANQAVTYPGVFGTATDSITKTHEGNASADEVTINNEVAYTNLVKNKKYTVNVVLKDKATGEVLKTEDGKEVSASKTFKAGVDENITDPFATLNSVLENLYEISKMDMTDEEIASIIKITPSPAPDGTTPTTPSEEDVADAVQTFKDAIAALVKPEIIMEKINKAIDDNDMTLIASDITPAIDGYNTFYNLFSTETAAKVEKPSTSAQVKTLVETAAAEKIASESGTVEHTSGTVTVPFALSGALLEGKVIVAFSEVYADETIDNNKLIAYHNNIKEPKSSVSYPSIDTVATIDGEHTGFATTETVIKDTVSYTNLLPGKTYALQGILMDKTSGESVKNANGNEYIITQEFTTPELSAEEADKDTATGVSGTVDVVFTFDATPYIGEQIVVFENLYRSEVANEVIKVASHEDMKDNDQTVFLKGVPSADEVAGELNDTGDKVLGALALCSAAALGVAGLYAYRRRKVC